MYGLSEGVRFGQPIALLYPLEPLAHMLDPDILPVTLTLVDHTWGDDQPLYGVAQQLATRGGDG